MARAIASRISAKPSPLSETSSAECRQGLMRPSAVRRIRLHAAQKCRLTGLIRPTRPFAPGRRYRRATPSLSSGRNSGRASRTRVKAELSAAGWAGINNTSRVMAQPRTRPAASATPLRLFV